MATKTVEFELIVTEVPPEPDFFPSVDPLSQSVSQGSVATYTVAFEPMAGFTGPVSLSVSGPEGAIAEFSANPIAVGETATLTVDTSGIAPGTYTLTLEATG